MTVIINSERSRIMDKPYSDSYLMKMSKKALIEYLRIAEHNHRVCEETLDQQAKNCMELLKKERAKAIDEFVSEIKKHHYLLCDNNGTDYGMFTCELEQIASELKGGEEE